jgi:hypothetical protein
MASRASPGSTLENDRDNLRKTLSSLAACHEGRQVFYPIGEVENIPNSGSIREVLKHGLVVW